MTIGETVNMVENNTKRKTNLLIGNHAEGDVTVIPEDIFRRCKLGRLQAPQFEKALRGRSKRSAL